MLNLSFEQGWDDVFIGVTGTSPGREAQQPKGWVLVARPVGSPLLSAGVFPNDDPPVLETVKTIPECKHVSNSQLPEDERLGGAKALVLDGEYVYKVFSAYSPFSVTLEMLLEPQETGASPGQMVKVVVPVNTHYHPKPGGDGSLGACRWRVKVNGAGGTWHTYHLNIVDRAYTYYLVNAKADATGNVKLSIDLESASEAGISYFVDHVTATPVNDQEVPYPGEERGKPRVQYERTFLLYPPRDKLTVTEFSQLHARLAGDILFNGWTSGFSADDAGIGDLDVRRVIVISVHPDDWDRPALLAFFAEHYPGVEVIFKDMFTPAHFPVGTDAYPPSYWYVPTSQLFSTAHPGIDINLDVAPWGDVERGMPIYAVAPGVVHYVTHNWSGVGMCVVKHILKNVPYWVMYAHIDINGLDIDQRVEAGQVLGVLANWTGGDGGDHLHFGVSTTPVTREYLTHRGWIDPVPWMKDVLGLDPVLVDAMLTRGLTPPGTPPPGQQPPTPPTPPTPTEPPSLGLRSNNPISLHSGEPLQYWDTYWTQSGANAMKCFSLGFAMEARRLVPDRKAVVVWRKHSDYVVGIDDDPMKLVERYTQEITTYCQNTGQTETQVLDAGLAVESLNEVIGTFLPDQTKRAVAFDVGFAEALHRRYGSGLKPVLLNVAIGNPHESEVPLLLPAARAAQLYGGYLGYHAYWTANEQRNFLTEHWDYHAGRWMRWDDVFRANGVYPRYVLSEGGIVYAWDGQSFHSGLGWRSCGPFPQYLDQMSTFASLVRAWNAQHNDRAVALTIFCHGNWGWDNFELGPGNVLLMNEMSVSWR